MLSFSAKMQKTQIMDCFKLEVGVVIIRIHLEECKK